MKPRGRNPVISVRVSRRLYEMIVDSAKQNASTMSEEIERRLRATFELDALRSYWLLKRIEALERK